MREASAGLDLTVAEADMAEFSLAESPDLIYYVRSTFFHLGTQERQLRCLALCAQHLAPLFVGAEKCLQLTTCHRWSLTPSPVS
jgi:hypothetical protein